MLVMENAGLNAACLSTLNRCEEVW